MENQPSTLESFVVDDWSALWIHFDRPTSPKSNSNDDVSVQSLLEEKEQENDERSHQSQQEINSYGNATESRQTSTNQEEWDLTRILPELQAGIVEKLPFHEFVTLNKTSKHGNIMCHLQKYYCHLDVDKIFINKKRMKVLLKGHTSYKHYRPRMVSFNVAGTSPYSLFADSIQVNFKAGNKRIREVCNMFKDNHTTCDHIMLGTRVLFEPEELDLLIRVTQARYLMAVYLPSPFFLCPALFNIVHMELLSCGITDTEFVKLPSIEDIIMKKADGITAKGLNKYLRQWKNGQREIFHIYAGFEESMGTRNLNAIIEGLDANPIWTPETHSDSIVGRLSLEEFRHHRPMDPPLLYSAWRPGELDSFLIIILHDSRLIIGNAEEETQFLYLQLSRDQYYFITGLCKLCQTQVCTHRRRFGMSRLKRAHSTLYNFLCDRIWYLSLATVAARMIPFALGERPFARLSRFDFQRRPRRGWLRKLLIDVECLFFDESYD